MTSLAGSPLAVTLRDLWYFEKLQLILGIQPGETLDEEVGFILQGGEVPHLRVVLLQIKQCWLTDEAGDQRGLVKESHVPDILPGTKELRSHGSMPGRGA